jgi:hypothetical protein
MPEIDRRHAAHKARREASEAAIAQAVRADSGPDALRLQWRGSNAR